MAETIKLQGRLLSRQEIQEIRQLIADHPRWTRWRLSRVLADRWNWRNGAGRLKDMAARTLLLKLQNRGLIQLPPRRVQPPKRMGSISSTQVQWDQQPLEMDLVALGTLQLREISTDVPARGQMAAALQRWHYLGYTGAVGENLQYVILTQSERPLGYALFGAAAWKCADRDQFIGWNAEHRERKLGLIANNSRFLLLPWVRVRGLGSWTLAQVSRRICCDWQGKYGHGVVLLETFVQRDRFQGTVYAAANWRKVGATSGRTRQDRDRQIQSPVKEIFVRPLRSDFREVLCA